MKSLISCFLVGSILVSCGRKDDSLSLQEGVILKTDWSLEEKLPIDEETAITNPLNVPVYLGTAPKLLSFASISNSLKFYDLGSKTLENSVSFPKQGPNSIQGIELFSGINFVNKDSVILVSPSYKTIYLANFAGEVYRTYDFTDFEYGIGSIGWTTPFAYRKGSLYIQAFPLSTDNQSY